ncbi:ORFL145C.iORF2 [Human betaherpesvirus 5]|nr:ORFL145C.iORF2 [Human betaherpesvirus 5]QHX40475.1 ORFL145C.iORF2 [Human betaherpesvirus 5]
MHPRRLRLTPTSRLTRCFWPWPVWTQSSERSRTVQILWTDRLARRTRDRSLTC